MTKTGQKLTISETADWLHEHDGFLILTHRRPDGDTIGCAGALARGLCEIGKTAYILHNPEATPRYIPYVEEFWAPEGFVPQVIITVDTASHSVFPVNGMPYADDITLCIDHHPSNTGYAQCTCIDGSLAACGELVYEILMALAGKISARTAACIYVALSTDTGCFAFANTTANTLRVASLAIDAGAPHREINRLMFRTRTRGRIKLEGLIFSGLEFYFDGAVAVSTITRAMMAETTCNEDDVDDIASIPGSVKGVLAGITIRELSSPGDCKVSVRTSPQVNANDICAQFGGGGHPMAAGFSLKLTVTEIKERLLEALSVVFPLEEQV